MIELLKRVASHFPPRYQQLMKRSHFARQMRNGTFRSDEAEFVRLEDWVKNGDWVLDIGANVGHYTVKLSALVGPTGRVIAIEPVPHSFELLAANAARCESPNITLLNVAASDVNAVRGMRLPSFDTGLSNYYMAQITDEKPELAVLCLSVDCIEIGNAVSLVKMDVEGHELSALKGMVRLLARDHPVLIVEGRSEEVASFLGTLGYSFEEAEDSPNRVFLAERCCQSI